MKNKFTYLSIVLSMALALVTIVSCDKDIEETEQFPVLQPLDQDARRR